MFFHDVILKDYTCTVIIHVQYTMLVNTFSVQKAIYTVLSLVLKASCHTKSYGIMASSWRSVCIIGCYRVNYNTACTLYIHVCKYMYMYVAL